MKRPLPLPFPFFLFLLLFNFLFSSLSQVTALKRNGAADLVVVVSDFSGEGDPHFSRLQGILLSIHFPTRVLRGPTFLPDYPENKGFPGSIDACARVLPAIVGDYPPGTIFLLAFERAQNRRPLLLKTDSGHFFVTSDSGVVAPLIKELWISELRELTNPQYFQSARELRESSNLLFDVLVPCAAHIARGIDLSSFGQKSVSYRKWSAPIAVRTRNGIRGHISWIDAFGNWQTNVSREDLGLFQIRPGDILSVEWRDRLLLFPVVENPSLLPTGNLFAMVDYRGALILGAHLSSLAAGQGDGCAIDQSFFIRLHRL